MTSQTPCNPTAETVVGRLPRNKALLTARDIADALEMQKADSVVAAIDCGALSAIRIGLQYRVARSEAERWIRSLEATR